VLTSLRPFLHLRREVFLKADRLDKPELFLDEKEEGRPNRSPLNSGFGDAVLKDFTSPILR
jgi:hypothetical protein